MIKLRYCVDICPNCNQAIKMVKGLKKLGVKVEVDEKKKAPWVEHPILYIDDNRISGDEVLNKLAKLGGDLLDCGDECKLGGGR